MPRQFLDPEVYREVRVRSRGYLPHWEVDGGTYFVTYRESDSLPQHVVERLRDELTGIRRSIAGHRTPTAVERAEIAALFGLRLDVELDVGHGRCHLARHAAIAAENLNYFDGTRYDLIAWAIMPNHVHVVFTGREPLARTIHRWKSYVAHQIGGKVFAREYFDRLIRDERDLERTVAYVRGNPAAAGLRGWPWVG